MKIDYVIPTYNSVHTLKSCLEAIKRYGNLNEIIVVDRFSEDKTIEIAKEYSCKVILPKAHLHVADHDKSYEKLMWHGRSLFVYLRERKVSPVLILALLFRVLIRYLYHGDCKSFYYFVYGMFKKEYFSMHRKPVKK